MAFAVYRQAASAMLQDALTLLLLIIIANGTPVVLRALMHDRLNRPLDFGRKLPDGQPVFGRSKTWRGVAGAVVVTSVAAVLLGQPVETGALVGVFAMIGDAFSSFVKRRLGMAPHSMAPLLDQVPESLLPALMVMHAFELDMGAIIILVSAFIVAELVLSLVLYRLGIRNRPY